MFMFVGRILLGVWLFAFVVVEVVEGKESFSGKIF